MISLQNLKKYVHQTWQKKWFNSVAVSNSFANVNIPIYKLNGGGSVSITGKNGNAPYVEECIRLTTKTYKTQPSLTAGFDVVHQLTDINSKKIHPKDARSLYGHLHNMFNNMKPRKNSVTRTNQTGINIGLNRCYAKKCPTVRENLLTQRGMPDVLKMIRNIVSKQNIFYTNIQINKNYPGNLHIDRSNAGPSAMLVVGKKGLRGGELYYNGSVYPTLNSITQFNGNTPHMTAPFEGGDRYSLVLYCNRLSVKDHLSCGGIKPLLNTLRKHNFVINNAHIEMLRNTPQIIYPLNKKKTLRVEAEFVYKNKQQLFKNCMVKSTKSQLKNKLQGLRA